MNFRGGLRVVAAFEAAKGILVLGVGIGLLGATQREVQAFAAKLIEHLHLNPASRTPKVFLQLLEQLDSTRLQLLAAGGLVYALIRLLEAYGLWLQRRWAELLGVGSAGVYLPFELYELWKGATVLGLATLTVNVAILMYLGSALNHRRVRAAR